MADPFIYFQMFWSHLDFGSSEYVRELLPPQQQYVLQIQIWSWQLCMRWTNTTWRTVTYSFGTGQDLLLSHNRRVTLKSSQWSCLRFWSYLLKRWTWVIMFSEFCIMSFVSIILCRTRNVMWTERVRSVGGAWIGIRGWHWLKRNVGAHCAVAPLSPLVTYEGCFRTKEPLCH